MSEGGSAASPAAVTPWLPSAASSWQSGSGRCEVFGGIPTAPHSHCSARGTHSGWSQMRHRRIYPLLSASALPSHFFLKSHTLPHARVHLLPPANSILNRSLPKHHINIFKDSRIVHTDAIPGKGRAQSSISNHKGAEQRDPGLLPAPLQAVSGPFSPFAAGPLSPARVACSERCSPPASCAEYVRPWGATRGREGRSIWAVGFSPPSKL